MSAERLLNTLRLRDTDRIAQTETLEHPAFLQKLTGIDPFTNPCGAMLAAVKKLDLDWVYSLPKKSYRFAEGETKKKLDDGSYVSEWGFTGSVWHTETAFPDEESVLRYDPFARFSSEEALHASIRSGLESTLSDQRLLGRTAVVTGLYYTTLFQWFILTFGWEMFLITAASEPERFSHTIARFADLSVEHAKIWGESDIPFFFCHDDLAITRGLVFEKQWYLRNIFPHYERIFAEIKKAGKPVIFVSDGNYTQIAADILAAGADGLLFDWTFDLDETLGRYGKDKVLIGNADTQVLTFGSMEDVKKEVRRCTDAGQDYPGYIFKCSNDLPHNIPLENIEGYFDTFAECRIRR